MTGSRAVLAIIVAFAAIGSALAGCASQAPTSNQSDVHGWVGTAQGSAFFLQWTRNGNDVTGTLAETELDANSNAKTKNYNESFKGTVSGDSVTLTFSGLFGASSNLSATIQGSNLVLSAPQTNGSIQAVPLSQGSVDEYNKDVSNLTGQAQANAQASAKASASAAIQQRIANEQLATGQDRITLNYDAYFKNLLTVMSTDLAQTEADVQHTQSDAAAGPGSECINASTIVFNDAATTVFNDVQTKLFNDSLNIENQVKKVRQDISKYQTDLQTVQNDGATGPPDAQSMIDGANQAIAGAIATANGYIDQGNASVGAAYQVADSIATGACSGMGPHNLPKPVSHIG